MKVPQMIFSGEANGKFFSRPLGRCGCIGFAEFSQREKEILQENMCQFDSKDVKKLIDSLTSLCREKIYIQEFSKISDKKNILKSMVANFKKTLRQLDQLESGVYSRYLQISDKVGNCPILPSINSEWSTTFLSATKKSKEARKALRDLIEILEKQLVEWTGSAGRPPADKTEFAFQIGIRFLEHLHTMPTTYQDGPFFKTVQVALSALDLPCKDPSKMVNHAVRRIKNGDK